MDERAIECPACGTEHTVALHGPVTDRRSERPSNHEYDPISEHLNRIACDHTLMGGVTDDFWIVYEVTEATA